MSSVDNALSFYQKQGLRLEWGLLDLLPQELRDKLIAYVKNPGNLFRLGWSFQEDNNDYSEMCFECGMEGAIKWSESLKAYKPCEFCNRFAMRRKLIVPAV